MNKLYIIGNGFDLHHNLKTDYDSFGKFLNEEYPDLYKKLLHYFGFQDVTSNDSSGTLWSEFEAALSDLDSQEVIESLSDYIAFTGDPISDWGAFEIEMQNFVDEVTYKLFDAFYEFLLKIKYPKSINGRKILLNKDALYLNFNYTNVLERYYGIPRGNILYIHGCIENGDTPILGHGVTPESLEIEEESPPKNATPEELEKWQEYINDNYNFSLELGKSELMTYFSKTFKDTDTIIKESSSFFSELTEIDEIIILGHSLSNVDLGYFKKVFSSVSDDTVWTVSYYYKDEMQSHINTLNNLGVKNSNIKLIKITDLNL